MMQLRSPGPLLILLILLLFLVSNGQGATESSGQLTWDTAMKQPAAWYGSEEALRLAKNVLLYQSQSGGWPKNTNLFKPIASRLLNPAMSSDTASCFDNGATTMPLTFLARVISHSDQLHGGLGEEGTFSTLLTDIAAAYEKAKVIKERGDQHEDKREEDKETAETKEEMESKVKDDRYVPLVRAFEEGFEYVLRAQYSNGGWPQFYPLRKGYYEQITFNDDAMINVMTLLRDISHGKPPFRFLDEQRRRRAAEAVNKGLECILQSQVRKQTGQLTAWCAQHDRTTLKPAWGRKFEPPSVSGRESITIIRYLMAIARPSAAVVHAIEAAVAWFDQVKLNATRLEPIELRGESDYRVVFDPHAPPLWARFYELETDRPLFVDRDSVFHYDVAIISHERRMGYEYYGDWPSALLSKDYPHWCRRLDRASILL